MMQVIDNSTVRNPNRCVFCNSSEMNLDAETACISQVLLRAAASQRKFTTEYKMHCVIHSNPFMRITHAIGENNCYLCNPRLVPPSDTIVTINDESWVYHVTRCHDWTNKHTIHENCHLCNHTIREAELNAGDTILYCKECNRACRPLTSECSQCGSPVEKVAIDDVAAIAAAAYAAAADAAAAGAAAISHELDDDIAGDFPCGFRM